MSAFSRAAMALHRDGNMAVLCDYTLVSGGPAIGGLPIILSTPDMDLGMAKMPSASAEILAATIAPYGAPSRGDMMFLLADQRTYRVEAAELDVHGLSYSLTLARV